MLPVGACLKCSQAAALKGGHTFCGFYAQRGPCRNGRRRLPPTMQSHRGPERRNLTCRLEGERV